MTLYNYYTEWHYDTEYYMWHNRSIVVISKNIKNTRFNLQIRLLQLTEHMKKAK